MKNILIIAAHPDDEVLGCGIAIQKHIENGDCVDVLILTDGSGSRYSKQIRDKHLINTKKANALLGVHTLYLRQFPDQKLDNIPLIDITREIEQHVTDIDIVYTHDSTDLNKDHRIVYEATITACRRMPGQNVKRLLSYWVPSSSEWMKFKESQAFISNWFVPAEEKHIKNKIKAMQVYDTEMRPWPHPRSEKALRNYAENFGIRSGFELAEPFQLIYNIE